MNYGNTSLKTLQDIAKLLRYYSLVSTTQAGSGHATSSLSAADLMAVLCFGGFFRFDPEHPEYLNNDRLIFSKGHASPLFYSIWTTAGKVSKDELMKLRKFESPLEGHPTTRFRYTEAATGSLGQGLSVGVGMALNAKLDHLPYKTYILLGDSEMAEGSVWEAIQIAAYYKLDNLIAILDVNRLGQRGETMYGHKVQAYVKRISAFGWQTYAIDGHNHREIARVYDSASRVKGRPAIVIAKTFKGKGVKIFENKNGWHGKALNFEELERALKDLGEVDISLHGKMAEPQSAGISKFQSSISKQIPNLKSQNSKLTAYNLHPITPYPTRKAYGDALVRIFPQFPNIVVLDGEVSNSTYAEIFKEKYPKQFFEMFIAEQNMVGAALGFSRCGKIPFVSTFAAFFTRAFDQIRMLRYSDANIKFVGSHAGVSIGEDGPSQMGLEDIAMFRTVLDSVVLYPADAVSTHALVEEAAKHQGIVYIRTTRAATPVIYPSHQKPLLEGEGSRRPGEGNINFHIGGSIVLRQSNNDAITVISAGITLFEALAAYNELKKEGINIRVIDLYSIKPIDQKTLAQAAKETRAIITVEDHYAQGGLGEAVQSAIPGMSIHILAVLKMPRSAKPQELLDYEEISRTAIIKKVKEIIK